MSHRSNSQSRPSAVEAAASDIASVDEIEADRPLASLLPAALRALVPSLSAISLEALQNSFIASGLVPDAVLRTVTRHLIRQRHAECRALDVEALSEYKQAFTSDLRMRAIAEQANAANAQHYEVPVQL